MGNLIKNNTELFSDSETLLAMVSHDLKNPVNAVMLAIDLLFEDKSSTLSNFQKEILISIISSLKYMQNLIFNILDRYRFNNNALEIHKTSVNFVEFVDSILKDLKYILLDKKQIIKVNTSLKNYFVELDILGIRQVINNLVINAFKYAPEESGITINIFENNSSIYFSIENEGNGIENLKNIFNKFVTNNTNNNFFATGLGLYIVKEIITMHKGEVFIENGAYNSTKVIFSLPQK